MINTIFDKHVPEYLKQLEEYLSNNQGPFLCGEKITIADFMVGMLWASFINNDAVSFAKERWATASDEYPKCKEYGAAFLAANEKRMSNREGYGV